jgi:NAD(P)-dependent dehydrogenase (short-subunit alcohol dehydrogenase family)
VQVTEADSERSERSNVKAMFNVFQHSVQRLADHGRLIQIGISLPAETAPGNALCPGIKAPCEEFSRTPLMHEVEQRGGTVNTMAPVPLDNPSVSRLPSRCASRPTCPWPAAWAPRATSHYR